MAENTHGHAMLQPLRRVWVIHLDNGTNDGRPLLLRHPSSARLEIGPGSGARSACESNPLNLAEESASHPGRFEVNDVHGRRTRSNASRSSGSDDHSVIRVKGA